mmetsp:Transcript_68833/g.199707  ORF Transcript_68833/g.199707 Transcript_68833/m.199707 type:complete len:204 (-) Transcript_68833:736-1347(-)
MQTLRSHEDAAQKPLRVHRLQPHQEVWLFGRREDRHGKIAERGPRQDLVEKDEARTGSGCELASVGHQCKARQIEPRGAGLLHLDVHAEPHDLRHVCRQRHYLAQLRPCLRLDHAAASGGGSPLLDHPRLLSFGGGYTIGEPRRIRHLRALPGRHRRAGGSRGRELRTHLPSRLHHGVLGAGAEVAQRRNRLPILLRSADVEL